MLFWELQKHVSNINLPGMFLMLTWFRSTGLRRVQNCLWRLCIGNCCHSILIATANGIYSASQNRLSITEKSLPIVYKGLFASNLAENLFRTVAPLGSRVWSESAALDRLRGKSFQVCSLPWHFRLKHPIISRRSARTDSERLQVTNIIRNQCQVWPHNKAMPNND